MNTYGAHALLCLLCSLCFVGLNPDSMGFEQRAKQQRETQVARECWNKGKFCECCLYVLHFHTSALCCSPMCCSCLLQVSQSIQSPRLFHHGFSETDPNEKDNSQDICEGVQIWSHSLVILVALVYLDCQSGPPWVMILRQSSDNLWRLSDTFTALCILETWNPSLSV